MVIDFDKAKGEVRIGLEYKEFLQRVIKNDEMWFLFADGEIATLQTENGDCTLFWSTKEGAEANRTEEWEDFEVQKMSPAEFISLCVPDFYANDVNLLFDFKEDEGIYRSRDLVEEDLFKEADEQGVDLEAMCDECDDFMMVSDIYDCFLDDLMAAGCMWVLADEDGGWVIVDVNGKDALPLFVQREEAEKMCEGEWSKCKPEKIMLNEFALEVAPNLEDDGITVMFAGDEDGGMGTTAATLAQDICTRATACAIYFDDEDDEDSSNLPHFNNVVKFPGKLN